MSPTPLSAILVSDRVYKMNGGQGRFVVTEPREGRDGLAGEAKLAQALPFRGSKRDWSCSSAVRSTGYSSRGRIEELNSDSIPSTHLEVCNYL